MVKKYVMDESKSWEDRYKELEAHHVEETTSLFNKLEDLREEVAALEKRIERLTTDSERHGYPWDD